jgi:hypothetical protein
VTPTLKAHARMKPTTNPKAMSANPSMTVIIGPP